ncbi:MAG: M3 family oligoendopeptidase [Oscillospiraceae bacterium]|nr:M3 family oligoendopeptidase [Oscillospiraceae bacterium]
MKFSQMPYERPNIEELGEQMGKLTESVKNAKSAKEVRDIHKQFTKMYKTQYTLTSLAYIRNSMDTKDEFYDGEKAFFDQSGPIVQMHGLGFYKAMVESPHRKELEDELGELWFVDRELALKGFDEKIIEEMQKANALTSKYDKLIASASIDFDGKKNNLAQLRAYMLGADREVRKKAYAKRTEFFLENAKELDEIFDELVKLRDSMAKKLGYKNFVELGYIWMRRNSYDAATVKRFRDQVKSVLVPFMAKVYEQTAKDLGVDKLKFYDEDIYFAEGNPTPKATPDEMFEAGQKMYNELSAETKEFFEFMQENELFDVLTREGKSGGGYCATLPDYGSPFVFANFNGTSEDVDVLTHECGHALATYMARDMEIVENSRYTNDVAEIHSMAMEFFTGGWMEMFFKEDTDRFLKMQIVAALAFIPYGCMVDEFQHIIYENPEMTPDERKAAWQKLEREYKPHLDFEDDQFFGKGGHWQRQLHIYRIPFYYIDYCLAQTCAIQYRIWLEENKDAAWKSYTDLLKKAGTRRFTDLVAEAGLKSPFENGCVEHIVKGVEKLLG